MSETIGTRNIETPWHAKKLEEVAKYIDHNYQVEIIEAVVNSHPARTKESIIIGAHYDTVNCSPGTDENASGIAAMLVIAKEMHPPDGQLDTILKLVALPNEEMVFNKEYASTAGSAVYAKNAKKSKNP